MADIIVEIKVRDNYEKGIAKLVNLREEIDDGVFDATEESMFNLMSDARENMPIRTGDVQKSLESSIAQTGNKVHAEVGTDHPAAKYTEYGTKAHVIEPKQAQALRFFKNSQEIFAASVMHPGNEEYAWLLRAGLAQTLDAPETFYEEINPAFEQASLSKGDIT